MELTFLSRPDVPWGPAEVEDSLFGVEASILPQGSPDRSESVSEVGRGTEEATAEEWMLQLLLLLLLHSRVRAAREVRQLQSSSCLPAKLLATVGREIQCPAEGQKKKKTFHGPRKPPPRRGDPAETEIVGTPVPVPSLRPPVGVEASPDVVEPSPAADEQP